MLTVYQTVHWLKHDGSGLGWTDEGGTTVTTPEDEAVWAGIVASRPNAWPFKGTGWPLYDWVAKLQPDKAKGSHVYRPSQGTVGRDSIVASPDDENESQSLPPAPSRSGSVDWDESQMDHEFGEKSTQQSIDPALKEVRFI